MPISPGKDESQDDWMGRCVPEMMSGDREQDQAVAACLQMWRDKSAVKRDLTDDIDPPDDDESKNDFMDRCMEEVMSNNEDADEGDVNDACEVMWEDAKSAIGLKHKTHTEEVHGMEF